MKATMMSFVTENLDFFRNRRIVTTNSTGLALEAALGLVIDHKVSSGPLGGDQEIGAYISTHQVAAVFFFRDPLSAHPHDADIVALGRLCDVHNVLVATNRSSGQAIVRALTTTLTIGALLAPNDEEVDSEVVLNYKTKQKCAISDAVAKDKQGTTVTDALRLSTGA